MVDKVFVQLSMPSRSALNRTANRQKQKNNKSSKVTITYTERNFALPDESKDFCRFDPGMNDKERSLSFGDATRVAALSTQKSLWLCNGTFKIVLYSCINFTQCKLKRAASIHRMFTHCLPAVHHNT